MVSLLSALVQKLHIAGSVDQVLTDDLFDIIVSR